LLFSDVVGSTALKQTLGDRAGVALLQQHYEQVRQVLGEFAGAEVIKTAGDSFLILFPMPSEAVRCALLLQGRLRQFNRGLAVPVQDRLGLHLGEVVIEEIAAGRRDVHGIQVDTCSRVMALAQGGQILLTRGVFDSARQMLKGEDIAGVGALSWVSHGRYLLKGVEEPVLGWRPAVGTVVPNTQWVLEQKLGEGGFGEVWLGRHQKLKERRVFKFCFRADRVRSLKREMTLFRVLKERVGDHPNIVRLLEVYFEEPPFYVVMDHVEGQDLRAWCERQGGAGKVPLAARLEIVAQIADALQAAHDAGVIHRDVKPANILVGSPRSEIRNPKVEAKLTDFGIGQVVSEEALEGVTKAGFTQSIVAESSSSQTGSQMCMAPELLAGKPATTRSDIYSLGVVLYQLLVWDFMRPITTDWQQEVSEPLLRDDLKHCFAGNPQDRFAGAGQLAKHLRGLPERRAALAREQGELAARERAAYRRGIARSATAASVIVVLLSGLVLFALNQAHRAKEAARDLRRHVYAADMNVAHEALEDNNLWLGAGLVRKHFPKAGEEDLRGFEWRYLWQRCQSDDFFTFREHNHIVTCAVFSPDGRVLATAGFDKAVKILDLGSRKVLATLEGFADVIGRNAPAFSPDGRLLAAADGRNITLWDTARWRRVELRSLLDNEPCNSGARRHGRRSRRRRKGLKGNRSNAGQLVLTFLGGKTHV
jgi:serine/threonine-protein kinase